MRPASWESLCAAAASSCWTRPSGLSRDRVRRWRRAAAARVREGLPPPCCVVPRPLWRAMGVLVTREIAMRESATQGLRRTTRSDRWSASWPSRGSSWPGATGGCRSARPPPLSGFALRTQLAPVLCCVRLSCERKIPLGVAMWQTVARRRRGRRRAAAVRWRMRPSTSRVRAALLA